ncbi:MAG TPA: glycosyltransferase family 4 protein [Thermomicrobiales bacterium]|jgi:glycosyltransferase involved in cell wall biosynthesis
MGNALLIGWRIPTPERDGSSLRTITLLRALRRLGYAVTHASDMPESYPPHNETLPEDTAAVAALGVVAHPGAALDYLMERGQEVDLLLFTGGIPLLRRYLPAMRRLAPRATIIFDTVDLHFVRQFRQARTTRNARTLARAVATKAEEFAAARAVDCTLVVSPTERELLAQECPDANVALVTDAHAVRADPPPFAGRRGFFFVGAYDFLPNIDAVDYYIATIRPLVLERLPGAHFTAIGSAAPPEMLAREAAGVTIAGHIPDLAPWFEHARLSIAPLRYGAGVKGKVLRSLGQGLPVVATTIAAEGLHVTHGENILIADEPAAFADAIATLHDDADLWARLSAGGRAVVAEHFSFDTVCAQLATALAGATASVR